MIVTCIDDSNVTQFLTKDAMYIAKRNDEVAPDTYLILSCNDGETYAFESSRFEVLPIKEINVKDIYR